ncbi:MAG: transglycosylase SLT domain-containing protein [Synergistaceae bacterium]|jgi:soluble lytic murein transglycosylase-like protein|nr:transglycosylase SLT domain-containing protein [Synergistaceae bacterium]
MKKFFTVCFAACLLAAGAVVGPLSGDPAFASVDARVRNEAKRQAIAALLRQYNKKLTEVKAYEYAVFIIQASDTFGQDPFLIASMVVCESSARADAVSSGGDYGLMQVRWRVHQKKITRKYPHIKKAKDMLNPKDNLMVGTEIFSVYRKTANYDDRGGLAYYTAGNRQMANKVFAIRSRLEKSYLERQRSATEP